MFVVIHPTGSARITVVSMKKKSKNGRVDWQKAPDIQVKIAHLISTLDMNWIDNSSIHCFRSENSRARAYARIWGLSKIWQQALGTDAAYCIEVLSEKFDKLPEFKQDEVLLHELAHIPKNFSGSLLPHVRKRGKRNFHDRVEELVARYKKTK